MMRRPRGRSSGATHVELRGADRGGRGELWICCGDFAKRRQLRRRSMWRSDLSARERFDHACLFAREGNIVEVSKYLESGGDPNRVEYRMPRHYPGYSLALEALRTENDLDHFKATQHRCEFLRMMKAHGLDPNIGHGHLFLLNNCGFPEEAALLLEWGVDVGKRDRLGRTPLFYCLDRERGLALARVLLAHGADLAVTNTSGQDVETFARREGEFKLEYVRNRFFAVADFIAEVKNAGSWKAYLKAPRVELVRLRALCSGGRASPPDPILKRLFLALPNEVFWHVLQFWRTDRDD